MDELHYLLMRSHTAMNRNVFREAQKLGLSSGQPKILEYLTERNGANQKAIAVYCGVEPATLGSILLRMEKNGLIERKRKEGDRRSLYVYITPNGLKAADDMKMVYDKFDALGAQGLSESELSQLKILLMKVFRNLNEG
ncbi:MAG: MarR family transcriptional regulator [Clostridia bacterium]|nr:MarR family transcriptional regulator [Clostridia bacterium]